MSLNRIRHHYGMRSSLQTALSVVPYAQEELQTRWSRPGLAELLRDGLAVPLSLVGTVEISMESIISFHGIMKHQQVLGEDIVLRFARYEMREL